MERNAQWRVYWTRPPTRILSTAQPSHRAGSSTPNLLRAGCQGRPSSQQSLYKISHHYTYAWDSYTHVYSLVLWRTLQWTYFFAFHTSTGESVESSQTRECSWSITHSGCQYSLLYCKSCCSLRRTTETTLLRMVCQTWAMIPVA